MAVEDYSRNGLRGLPGINREPSDIDIIKSVGIGVGGTGMNQLNRPSMDEPVGQELAKLGVGNSRYDQDLQTMSEAENLENFRANNQSGLAQITNGLLKMGGTALTTLADGTVGMLYGIGKGISNALDNDDNTTFWQGLWDNDFNKAMASVQEAMEEILPNYYTEEQRNSSWNSAANLLSANFLGDKLIKNAGFTIGAMATMAIPGFNMAWLGRGMQAVATGLKASKGVAQDIGAISKYLASTLVSANGEASIEAINAVKDGQKSMYSDLDARAREAARQSELQMQEDIISGMPEDIARQQHLERTRRIDEEVALGKQQVDDRLRDVGNSVYGANMAILSLSNGLQFGEILKGGFNMRKSLSDYGIKLMADGKEVGAREFGRNVFNTGVKTQIQAAKSGVDYGRAALDTAKRFAEEGWEEGSQNLVSDSNQMQAAAKLQEWATDRYNSDHNKYSLWEKQINPQVTADMTDYMKALMQTWSTNFGTFSSPGWEEVLLGGLTGSLGTAGIRRNPQGKLGIGWQGGFMEAVREQKNELTETDKAINRFNDMLNSPEFRNNMMHAAGKLAATYDMEAALDNNDILQYKNAEMMSVINDAIYFRDNGLLDVFKGYYEEAANNVSDETVKDLRSQLVDVRGGKSYLDEMTDDDIKSMVKDKASSTLTKIEDTINTYEEMERKFTDKFRNVDIEPYLAEIKNPAIRTAVNGMMDNMIKQGIGDMTHYKALYDDMQRRKKELQEELEGVSDTDIDADATRTALNKDIAELDKAMSEVKDLYNDYAKNPAKMMQGVVKAAEDSVKRIIGKEEKDTIARYLTSESLQEVADTFMYGNYNSEVLDKAIKQAETAKLDDKVKLLKKFYPFTVESNAIRKAIDTVADEVFTDATYKEGNKRWLGRTIESVMNDVLMDTTDSTGSLSTAIKKDADRRVDEAVTPEEAILAVQQADAMYRVAEEINKAVIAASTPTTTPPSTPKPTPTTPASASAEAAEEKKDTKGDSPKPEGVISPEAAAEGGTMSFDPEEFDKEVTIGEEAPTPPTPPTGSSSSGSSTEPSITDNLLKAIDRVTKYDEFASIERTAKEAHDNGLISDEDFTRLTGAINHKKFLVPSPSYSPTSTGDRKPSTPATSSKGKIESRTYGVEEKDMPAGMKATLDALNNWFKKAEGRLTFDRASHKYYLDGKPLDYSVTGYLDRLYGRTSPEGDYSHSQAIGNTMDEINRDFFHDPTSVKTKKYPNLNDARKQEILEDLERFKKILDKSFPKGYTVITDDNFKLAANIHTPEGVQTIGGATDMIVIDDQGNINIFDFKAKKNKFSDFTNAVDYTAQQNMYMKMLETIPGLEEKTRSLRLVWYNTDYPSLSEASYKTNANGQVTITKDGESMPIQESEDFETPRLAKSNDDAFIKLMMSNNIGGKTLPKVTAIDLDTPVSVTSNVPTTQEEVDTYLSNNPDPIIESSTLSNTELRSYLEVAAALPSEAMLDAYLIDNGIGIVNSAFLHDLYNNYTAGKLSLDNLLKMAVPVVKEGAEKVTGDNGEEEEVKSLPETEVKIVRPNRESQEDRDKRLSDKSFTAVSYQRYSGAINSSKQGVRGVAKPKSSSDLYKRFRELLASKNIDFEYVVNNYLYEMLTDGKLEVNYMVMRDKDNNVAVGSQNDRIHIFLVTKASAKMLKYAETDQKLAGNIKKINGEKMVVVGLLDCGNNQSLIDQLTAIRGEYNKMSENDKRGEFTLIPNLHNFIYEINPGAMIRSYEGEEEGDVDLATLLVDDRAKNPRNLKIGDIRFAIAVGKEGNVELRYFQAHRNDEFLSPINLPASSGNVWMFVRDARGTFVPTPISPTSYNDEWYKKESKLGQKIEKLIESLATEADLGQAKKTLAQLNSYLVFNGGDTVGNRIFFDDKTGEISHRVMNIKGGSLLEDRFINDDTADFKAIGTPIHTFTIGVDMSDEQKASNIAMLHDMIKDINPTINISRVQMGTKNGAEMYLEAGILRVGLRSLGVSNAQAYLYQVDDTLQPTGVRTAATDTRGTIYEAGRSVYVGSGSNNRYTIRGEKWYDHVGKEVTDPALLEVLDVALQIANDTIKATKVNGVDYWESNTGVFSRRKTGNLSKLGEREVEAYRKAKSKQEEKAKKEQELKDAAKNEKRTEPPIVKYKVGDTIKGYTISSVSTENGIVSYSYTHPYLGTGIITQEELDNLPELTEDNQLEILLNWANGSITSDEAKEQLRGTKYVKVTQLNPVLHTGGGVHFTPAVEMALAKYIEEQYPFLSAGDVKVATGVSTVGGDANLLIVKDPDGIEYGTPSNFLRSLAQGGRATEAIAKGQKKEKEVKKSQEEKKSFYQKKVELDNIRTFADMMMDDEYYEALQAALNEAAEANPHLREIGLPNLDGDPDAVEEWLAKYVGAEFIPRSASDMQKLIDRLKECKS